MTYPVTDVVVMLLETPFRRWNSDSKNDLLKMGKPIPILSALAPDKKLSLQARVKEVAPNALFTHCLAHRLNLVLQHGCSINAKCRIFFANLTVNEWSGFINVFDCISKDPKSSSESICGAIGHFKNLKTFEFAFLALIFSDTFIYTDNLFNVLQNKSFDVEFCLRKINITYDLINKKRNEPEFLKLFNQAVTLTKPPKATRNESNNQSNFKILFYEIIDNILMQLNTRFQDTNKLLFLQLADVTKFKEYFCTFPVNALNNLKSTYSNIFYNINSLKVELEVLYSDVKYENLLHIYDMVKIIEKDALKDILPEAYKLFILILTIPLISVSNERSFSCPKRIKTCSRNSISQVRFSSLSILSIEKFLINQLKKTESFYDDIINIGIMNDRHKTPRVFASGSQNRKLKAERNKKSEETLAKTSKLTNFFKSSNKEEIPQDPKKQ
ncbi:hypothetical protein QTP88_000512 [Uroleucon formosanum]